jgi:hypothetical protein
MVLWGVEFVNFFCSQLRLLVRYDVWSVSPAIRNEVLVRSFSWSWGHWFFVFCQQSGTRKVFFMCVNPVMEQVGFGFLVNQLFCLWRIWIVRDIQASASWDLYIQKKSDIERSWLNDYIALFSCNSWKLVAGRFYGFLDVCEFLNTCHTIGIKGWISNLLVLLIWVS